MKPIYFSKVEYIECLGPVTPRRSIILDLVNKELVYQVFEWSKEMPAIQFAGMFKCGDFEDEFNYGVPSRVIRNGKNNFKGQVLRSESWTQEIVFSYGKKLSDKQVEELLPYCNALEFEPYRGKEMSMDDEGFIGYRDEISTYFTAITESYIPKLELPMNYYYDEEHIWPSEKLYRYLIKTYFENNKKLKGYEMVYGGHSLFWR